MEDLRKDIQENSDMGFWPTGAKRSFTASGWRKFQAKIRKGAEAESSSEALEVSLGDEVCSEE